MLALTQGPTEYFDACLFTYVSMCAFISNSEIQRLTHALLSAAEIRRVHYQEVESLQRQTVYVFESALAKTDE